MLQPGNVVKSEIEIVAKLFFFFLAVIRQINAMLFGGQLMQLL
jgi:hypothetical protein